MFFSCALILSIFSCFTSCHENNSVNNKNIRPLKDTVGFAQYSWQMDSLMAKMSRKGWETNESDTWRLAICPHDDYTYVGTLYPELLQGIKAPNLILLGVAHSAARMGISDSLVFDSFTAWKGPWKDVTVSPVRQELFNILKGNCAIINDSLHKAEHSVEAMIPFLQHFNRSVTIIPVLVPAMSPERMDVCGKALANAIKKVAEEHKWKWGKDFAIIVTTDAVHYGNEDWGGTDYAFYGCDEKGNSLARAHEQEIMQTCLSEQVTKEKIRKFNAFTLDSADYRKYKWTWCGRYSVPVALYTAFYLDSAGSLSSGFSRYSTSITSDHISVDDLIMGRTAIATACHWVGYAALGYK